MKDGHDKWILVKDNNGKSGFGEHLINAKVQSDERSSYYGMSQTKF